MYVRHVNYFGTVTKFKISETSRKFVIHVNIEQCTMLQKLSKCEVKA